MLYYKTRDTFLIVLWAVMVCPHLEDLDNAIGLSIVWVALVYGVVLMGERGK